MKAAGERPLSLASLLVLLLVPLHLWYNPASSALMLLAAGGFLILDLLARSHQPTGRWSRLIFLARLGVAGFLVAMAAVLPLIAEISARRATAPHLHSHDGLIQTEEAIRYLLEGRNPYAEDYLATPMADWPGYEVVFEERVPSPLFHYVYLPWMFLFSLPLYGASLATLGWYDQRFLHALLLIALFALILLLPRDREKRLALLLAVGLNLYLTLFLADGHNDVVVLFWLVLSVFLLDRGRVAAAAIPLALACASKQWALPILPFYALYVGREWRGRQTLRQIATPALLFLATAAVVVLPFVFWDTAAFLDDTLLYASGLSATSFPIWGIGFGRLLLASGLVASPEAYFPFWLPQIVAGLPLLIWLLRWQQKENHLGRLLLGFGLFTSVLLFFSRFFLDAYVGYLTVLLTLGYFLGAGAPRRANAHAVSAEVQPLGGR